MRHMRHDAPLRRSPPAITPYYATPARDIAFADAADAMPILMVFFHFLLSPAAAMIFTPATRRRRRFHYAADCAVLPFALTPRRRRHIFICHTLLRASRMPLFTPPIYFAAYAATRRAPRIRVIFADAIFRYAMPSAMTVIAADAVFAPFTPRAAHAAANMPRARKRSRRWLRSGGDELRRRCCFTPAAARRCAQAEHHMPPLRAAIARPPYASISLIFSPPFIVFRHADYFSHAAAFSTLPLIRLF